MMAARVSGLRLAIGHDDAGNDGLRIGELGVELGRRPR